MTALRQRERGGRAGLDSARALPHTCRDLGRVSVRGMIGLRCERALLHTIVISPDFDGSPRVGLHSASALLTNDFGSYRACICGVGRG